LSLSGRFSTTVAIAASRWTRIVSSMARLCAMPDDQATTKPV
jgi:hypothetical protein